MTMNTAAQKCQELDDLPLQDDIGTGTLRSAEIMWDRRPEGTPLIELDYTNHRGERSIRWVALNGCVSRDPAHHDGRWGIEAWDVKRGVWRIFDPAKIHRWTEVPAPATLAEVPEQVIIPDTGVRSYIPEGDLTERMHFMVEAALQDGFKPHEGGDELEEDGGDTYVATARQIVGFALRMLDSGARGTGRIMSLVNGKTAVELAAMVAGPPPLRDYPTNVDSDVVATTVITGNRMAFLIDPVTSESYLPVIPDVRSDLPVKFWPQPRYLNQLAAEFHRDNEKWWVDIHTGARLVRNDGELLLLVVSEIIEGFEGIRKNLMDDKLPWRRMIEVEIADAFIRLFDFAGARNLDVDGAVAEKRAFNAVREDHTHEARLGENGKKF